MSNDLWRWADPDGQQRRVRLDELRAALAGGVIAPNTPVWRAGFRGWVPAHDVPELTTSALAAANGVVPNIPPPPLAVVAVQHEFEATAGVPEEASGEEPPPPPAYVPAPVKPSIVPPAPASSASRLSGAPGKPSSAQMASSLPTAIGLPPPPDLLAAVNQAKASAAAANAAEPTKPTAPSSSGTRPMPSKPPPPVKRASAPEASPGMIEELSGSAFLPESDPRLVASRPDDLPPPTDPIVHGDPLEVRGSQDSIPGVPRPAGLTILIEDIRALRAGQKPKNRLIFPVLGLLGFSVLITVVAGVVTLVRSGSGDAKTTTSSSSTITSSAPSAVAAKDAPPPVESATPAPAKTETAPAKTETASAVLGPCTLVGEDKVLAPRALVAAGIEATTLDGKLALGFAPAPGNGNVLTLDPSDLKVASTVKGRGPTGDVKRVTPALVNARVAAFVDGDRKGDKLASRRAVGTSTPIDVGVAEGAIVWAPHNKDAWAKVAPLEEGAGPVEALRVMPLASQKGIAFVYRRDGAVFLGAATGEGKLDLAGSVAKMAGLGDKVGSPALATSDDQVVVAWADRASADAPWKVRWTRAPVGGAASEATTFEVPAGGPGEHAMSPAVAGLGKGRFLLAWTEGKTDHRVRAITIDESGKALGEPITVSGEKVNAGQPAIAVGTDGRGVVAFLGAKGKSYELRAAAIRCGR